MRCANIAPGVCCQSPTTLLGFAHVAFSHLSALDIAAVWAERRDNSGWRVGGCGGRIRDTGRGPGVWEWRSRSEFLDPAQGASYITMPVRLPPDPAAVGALEVQGILGLVWGGGKWFAGAAAAERYLDGRSHPMRRRMDRRSALDGDVLATSPGTVAWPSSMEINGTEYEADERAGDFMYRINGTGELRNFMEAFGRK